MNSAEQIFPYPTRKELELPLVKAGQEGVLPKNESAKIIEFPQAERAVRAQEGTNDGFSKNAKIAKIEQVASGDNDAEQAVEISAKIQDMLRKENILVRMGEVDVFDVTEFLGEEAQKKFRRTTVGVAEGKYKNITKTMLFLALKDLKVLSWEDYLHQRKNKEDLQTKPLFNIPDSLEDAFDLQSIRNKEYYLNYWDVFADKRNGQHPTWSLDMQAKNSEVVNMKEFAFATKLFRDFQAQRNEKGELEVFDSNKKEYEKLSLEWMRENLGAYGNYTKGYISPQQFLIDNCQNLLRKGLVRLNDFEIITNSPTSNLLRKEFFITEDSPYFMAKGVKYYIGRKNFIFENQSFPINKIKITILNENTAGVVLVDGGREEVICVLDLLGEQERAEKSQGNSKSYVTINKDELNRRMHSWKRTDDNKQLGNETLSDYAKRMDSMADYGYIKKVTEDFALQKMGIHNLSWREQQWLVSAALELGNDYPRLLEFGKNYGVAGLKTFLSCEYGLENGKKILELGEKLSFEEANLIFAKYNEISDVAERNTEELIDKYFNKKDRNITEEQYSAARASLLQKSKDLLLNFSKQIYGDNEIKGEALMLELEKIKTDTIFFTSVFKNFAKNNPEASFEDFKGLSLETMSSPEVKKYSERFFEIANENNQNENPVMQVLVREGIQKGLESEKTVFNVLLKDEQPIALDRFDDEGGYYYYGSVNVARDFQKSAIFEQMKKEGLDQRAKEKPIRANADSTKEISSKYIEDAGFVGKGVVIVGEDREIVFGFSLERNDQENKKYQYRQNVSTQQLKAMENQLREDLESGAESRKELVRNRKPFVVSFEESQRPTFFKLADKLMRDYGYVISRYFFDGKTGGKFFAGFEQEITN